MIPICVRLRWVGMFLMVLVSSACTKQPDLVLTAAADFPVLQVPGFAPAYVGVRRNHKVIAVDADRTGYQFGAAQTAFSGASGVYDIQISTLGDGDGASTYKLAINDQEQSEVFLQPQTREEIMTFTWKGIALKTNDQIRVMSNGSDSARNAGGKGPNGFHMGHGRWISLSFFRQD